MAIALVQSATGTSTSGTVSWAFSGATTSGNLIVGAFAADDYNGSPTSGWTQSSEMEQQGFHGSYLWWRISTGETNPQAYTIGSSSGSCWMLAEFSGIDASPYDTSQGLLTNSTLRTYDTDNITPSSGGRLLVATLGGSGGYSLVGYAVGAWTNSFTAVGTINTGNTSATNDIIGMAYRLVTGNGSTAFSTGGEYGAAGGQVCQSRSALIIAFKEAAGGGSIKRWPPQMQGGMRSLSGGMQ